ncbi:MAG: HAMP domain-containing histidine kinase [Bacteriovoracaceae bacterium]|nr:HAMP domain-containing histidine kinase [Bacteriovoracaceae bacterium]
MFDQKIEEEKIELANQVAHDIRSPLAALEAIDLNQLPDINNRRLAKDSLKRLKGIAEVLLEKGRAENNEVLPEVNLNSLINNVIESKKIEFKNRKIETKITSQEGLANIHEIKLESILSNLLTNAFEASDMNSSIIVESEICNKNYIIRISDHGKGISAELLAKLGKEKVSFDKTNGNGLGVYYALQIINSWGGALEIKSQVNVGTTIKISLPITVNQHSQSSLSILIDNDELVCLTWEMKAKKAGIDLKIFRSSVELFSNVGLLPIDACFYIDSELDNEKGENIAQKLFSMGFLNLNMCTGYSKDKFAHLPFIKKVINKSPPF